MKLNCPLYMYRLHLLAWYLEKYIRASNRGLALFTLSHGDGDHIGGQPPLTQYNFALQYGHHHHGKVNNARPL